jgi:hypothetical protein
LCGKAAALLSANIKKAQPAKRQLRVSATGYVIIFLGKIEKAMSRTRRSTQEISAVQLQVISRNLNSGF